MPFKTKSTESTSTSRLLPSNSPGVQFEQQEVIGEAQNLGKEAVRQEITAGLRVGGIDVANVFVTAWNVSYHGWFC
jgi:hypothetical protein